MKFMVTVYSVMVGIEMFARLFVSPEIVVLYAHELNYMYHWDVRALYAPHETSKRSTLPPMFLQLGHPPAALKKRN